MRLILISILMIASLSACGFQLRGSYQLPPELHSINLQIANNTGELARALQRSLRNSGVKLSDEDEVPELIVGEVRHQRRVLSVNAEGDPQEYELLATTAMTIPETASGYVLPSRQLQVRRDYVYASAGVLSSSDQETQLKLEMERELAGRILRILQSQR